MDKTNDMNDVSVFFQGEIGYGRVKFLLIIILLEMVKPAPAQATKFLEYSKHDYAESPDSYIFERARE